MKNNVVSWSGIECKWYSWQEDVHGDVVLTHCSAEANSDKCEGNCTKALCPAGLLTMDEFKVRFVNEVQIPFRGARSVEERHRDYNLLLMAKFAAAYILTAIADVGNGMSPVERHIASTLIMRAVMLDECEWDFEDRQRSVLGAFIWDGLDRPAQYWLDIHDQLMDTKAYDRALVSVFCDWGDDNE